MLLLLFSLPGNSYRLGNKISSKMSTADEFVAVSSTSAGAERCNSRASSAEITAMLDTMEELLLPLSNMLLGARLC